MAGGGCLPASVGSCGGTLVEGLSVLFGGERLGGIVWMILVCTS